MRYFEVASKLIAQEPNKEITGHGLGLRHIQILLQFSLAAILVAMNMSLPIAIVAITTPGNPGNSANLNWTDQSLILVTTQIGYAATQLFGGCVSRAYGYQFVMCVSMLLCSVFCVILPVLTDSFGSNGLVVCLLVQGASQGFSLPVIPDFLDKWVPTSERNSIGFFMYAANILGSAFATKIAAILSSSFMCWYSTYYIFGAIGFVWIYFMTRYGRNCPEDCDDISAPEREFIKHEKKTRDKVPWLKILTSPALLAIWAAHAGTFWTIWLMTAEIPSYLTHVLKYSVFKDGQVVGDAYFMSWLCSFIMSGLTGYLIKSKILTLNVTRKICQSIASFLTALCLIILGFISDPHWVVFLINVIFMSLSASFWGFMLNYNDITHNRGVVTEVGNFIGTVTTILPAVLKHFIVSDQTDGLRWGIMFWITAIVAILSNTAFFFFSSGDIQEWDSDSALNRIEESRFLMKRAESMSKRYNNSPSFEEKQQTKTTIDCEREKKPSSEEKGPTKSDDSSK